MDLVVFSDCHGDLPKDLPKCDVVCICGDFVPLDYQRNITKSISWFCLEFVPWADSLSCKKVIFMAGNHDFWLETLMRNGDRSSLKPATEILKDLLPGINKGKHNLVYLRDSSIEIDGVRFYGTPWIQDLSNWAFYGSSADLISTWSYIPKKCDVLLTHQPPKLCDCGKVLQKGVFNTFTDYGSNILADALLDRNIKYTFCGHVHSGNHILSEYKEGCKIANVAIKDENYKRAYNPLFISI